MKRVYLFLLLQLLQLGAITPVKKNYTMLCHSPSSAAQFKVVFPGTAPFSAAGTEAAQSVAAAQPFRVLGLVAGLGGCLLPEQRCSPALPWLTHGDRWGSDIPLGK